MKASIAHNDALWAIVVQFLLMLLLLPGVWWKWTLPAAGSWFVGGLVCVLPNIYLYRRVFSFFGARQAKKIISAFYWGEAIKLLLTAICFVGALQIPWILPLWVFLGYIFAQIGFWIAPIVLGFWRGKRKKLNDRQ